LFIVPPSQIIRDAVGNDVVLDKDGSPMLNPVAKIGKASTPLDLMTYDPENEQPSVFFLQETPHQSILTVFNWTKTPRSHTLKLSDLGLNPDHKLSAFDVLNGNAPILLSHGAVQFENQSAESVRVIKLIDDDAPPSPPNVKARVPSTANAGVAFHVSAQTEPNSVPAIGYKWDFGDGITATGSHLAHTYTQAADFTIRLTVDAIDGLPAMQTFTVKVTGKLKAFPNLTNNRRFREPTDH
jgi:alpha-galactosidase